MDMMQQPEQGEEPQATDHMALMKQAYDLLGKAIAAAGGQPEEGMSVEDAFAEKGFKEGFGGNARGY